jgi:hypothetical protein
MVDSVPLGNNAVIHDVSKGVLYFLLGDTSVFEFYVPTFRNILFNFYRLID